MQRDVNIATIFKSSKKVKDPATGKRAPVISNDGKPVMLPKWRTVIIDHKGVRCTFTLFSNKQQVQKQTDMLEQREREIKTGIMNQTYPWASMYQAVTKRNEFSLYFEQIK